MKKVAFYSLVLLIIFSISLGYFIHTRGQKAMALTGTILDVAIIGGGITGDNYARGTGWVEVAINNSAQLLITEFKLPRAPWIDPDYDLGP